MPRIFGLVQTAMERGEDAGTARALSPAQYTLGTGHCRFFYTRLSWLRDRYAALVAEMLARGYSPAFPEVDPRYVSAISRQWWGQWEPTPACQALNVERINLRLEGMGLHGSKLILLDGAYRVVDSPISSV